MQCIRSGADERSHWGSRSDFMAPAISLSPKIGRDESQPTLRQGGLNGIIYQLASASSCVMTSHPRRRRREPAMGYTSAKNMDTIRDRQPRDERLMHHPTSPGQSAEAISPISVERRVVDASGGMRPTARSKLPQCFRCVSRHGKLNAFPQYRHPPRTKNASFKSISLPSLSYSSLRPMA